MGSKIDPSIVILDYFFVLYSNMQFATLNSFIDLYLGNKYDVFNDAIKNDDGNFVMLGTKQVPVDENANPIEYKTDLLLIEIDQEGNPIDKNK